MPFVSLVQGHESRGACNIQKRLTFIPFALRRKMVVHTEYFQIASEIIQLQVIIMLMR